MVKEKESRSCQLLHNGERVGGGPPHRREMEYSVMFCFYMW